MLRYIFSFFISFKERHNARKQGRVIRYVSSISMRQYKVALIDAFERAGPHTKQLILLRIGRGTMWSQRQFDKILAKNFAKHSALTLNACAPYVDYDSLRVEFALWSKNFFLAPSTP
jgi:hypothetical protein